MVYKLGFLPRGRPAQVAGRNGGVRPGPHRTVHRVEADAEVRGTGPGARRQLDRQSRATNARSRTSRPSRPRTSADSSKPAKSRSTASSTTPSDPPRERGLSTLDPTGVTEPNGRRTRQHRLRRAEVPLPRAAPDPAEQRDSGHPDPRPEQQEHRPGRSQGSPPLHYGRSGGIGARREDETLPTAGNQKYKSVQFDLAYLYGRARFTGQAIQKTKTDAGAFIRVMTDELDRLRDDLALDTARQYYGSTVGIPGAIAKVASVAGSVVTLTSDEALQKGFLHIGMLVDAGVSGTASSGHAAATADHRRRRGRQDDHAGHGRHDRDERLHLPR
jgi:hypothetical protein